MCLQNLGLVFTQYVSEVVRKLITEVSLPNTHRFNPRCAVSLAGCIVIQKIPSLQAVWTNFEVLMSQQSFFHPLMSNHPHRILETFWVSKQQYLLKAQMCSWFTCCIPVDQNQAGLLSSGCLLYRLGRWGVLLAWKEHVDAGRAPGSPL